MTDIDLTKFTCPKYDGGDGSVYIVVSTSVAGVAKIQNVADGERAIVPQAWLVPVAEVESKAD